MPRNPRTIILIPAYNEQAKIGAVLDRISVGRVDAVAVIDDGSTDDTAAVARSRGALLISLPSVRGVGAALREGLNYARSQSYEVAVIMAGNNKDDPREIDRLLEPIYAGRADLVVGSRFLDGGGYGGDMPAYRKWATRLHPWLMSLFAGVRLTESTNGFRALRLSMLDDARIRLSQRWLDGYGLEVYLLFKALKLGYRHCEVPCTKLYPAKELGYTKMRPVVGWWDILRPIYLLGLGLRG